MFVLNLSLCKRTERLGCDVRCVRVGASRAICRIAVAQALASPDTGSGRQSYVAFDTAIPPAVLFSEVSCGPQ